MSKFNQPSGGTGKKRAVALQYEVGESAPVVVASGMGHLAEKIVSVAQDSGIPIYEDDSLATILTQLKLGQEIPQELYRAIVEIYVYFLNFDPETGGTRKKTFEQTFAPPSGEASGGDQAAGEADEE